MNHILKISAASTTSEISDDFNRFFPFLKLAFFKHSHAEKEASMRTEMISESVRVGEIENFKKEGIIELVPLMSVGVFETIMRDEFGLNVHVFRKSGKVWLETTTTDHLTIISQNALGQEKSTPIEKEDINNIDYD